MSLKTNANQSRPLASVSLDLDNLWAYLKTHGNEEWRSFPSYLHLAVPRILEFLKRHDWKITFFVVGQDAALKKNHEALQAIVEAGHEIANHSYHHEPWLHRLSNEQLENEVQATERVIQQVTGVRTRGFRGPGFSSSERLIDILVQRNYSYDASAFHTFLGPAARAYYFLKSRLDRRQKRERKNLFGHWRDGFGSNRPYFWQTESGHLLEVPVTTTPLFKTPFHASYLMYLACYSPALARFYLHLAIRLCRTTRLAPSFLLHPLEFLELDDAPQLDFFPGMRLPLANKSALLDRVAHHLNRHYQVVPLQSHAAVAVGQPLPTKSTRLLNPVG